MSETVKPFSDEDVKYWKFHCTGNGKWAFADGLYCTKMLALLARLAAAEDLATGVRNDSRLSAVYKAEVQKWLATRGIGV